MDQRQTQSLIESFEAAKLMDAGEEVWSARDLMALLGYTSWRSFKTAIDKAILNAKASGLDPASNFIESQKVGPLGSRESKSQDFRLTRGASYLIALNADPMHEAVAFAKVYFVVQTRTAEIIQQGLVELNERIQARAKLVDTEKELADTLWERGVDGKGIGIIRSAGDSALFGGLNTKDMKARLGLPPKGKPLADKLHTVAIKAKELTAAMTTHNADLKDLVGQAPLQQEHVTNNKNIRTALESSGIKPEDLPPGEDTAKTLRRLTRQRRSLGLVETTHEDPQSE